MDQFELEDQKWFKAIIQIIFYSTFIFWLISLFSGWWGYAIWYVIIFALFILWYMLAFNKRNYLHAIKDFINLIDGPVDAVKEYLHCMKLPFGYQLNISFIMKNRKTTWDIIRKWGYYDNCDPEDFPENQ